MSCVRRCWRHTYWNLRGLKVDLVILNEEAITYDQPLQNQLARLIQTYAQVTGTDQPGGVFLRPAKDMTDEDRTLVLSAARVVLIAARGPLAQQIAFTVSSRVDAPALVPMPHPIESASETVALSPIEVKLDNGFGGFTPDGAEYIVNLTDIRQNTPAPWINVIAGPSFGTLVTEAGIGYTWHGNSQSNRITPWSNDPISNPIGDALYLRDEESGAVWSPTPLADSRRGAVSDAPRSGLHDVGAEQPRDRAGADGVRAGERFGDDPYRRRHASGANPDSQAAEHVGSDAEAVGDGVCRVGAGCRA